MRKTAFKKPMVPIAVISVTAAVIITGVLIMLFYGKDNNIGKTVTDIELLTLRLSGMRVTEEYEIKADSDRAEISYYTFSYANGQEEKVLRKRAECDTAAVIEALNSFDFISWNNFHGKHPKGVLDGRMFSLSATLNGGQNLTADGSENFPKHFKEFEHWLYEILKDCEELG